MSHAEHRDYTFWGANVWNDRKLVNIFGFLSMHGRKPTLCFGLLRGYTSRQSRSHASSSGKVQTIICFVILFDKGRRGMHIGYWWASQKERDH
jgi:hypothetical protein